MASFGKSVGRVSIRAIPDGTQFRSDLKRILVRAETTMQLNMLVAADTSSAEAGFRRLQRDWNGKQITVDAAATTAIAAASLRVLTRPRIVTLLVEVSKSSMAKAATLIASLSGARVAGDLVKNLSERLQNLDRALPKIALVSTSIGTLTSALLASVGGIFTLGAGLTQILGLAAALPGILTGAAVGGTALALALADLPTQLARLKPAFTQLQDVVSARFWNEARKPVISFVRATLPEFQEGMAATATEVGKWATVVLSSIQTAFGGGRITAMFEPLLRSIEIASTGALGFAQALAVLGQVGGSYLPRLAQWVADLSNRFGAYLLQIEESGRLVEIIDAGIVAAQLLGSSLSSLVSIWSGISDAAMAAGGGGLASFAATLAAIATIINSPAFQGVLTQIFAGASAGASGLATSLAPIGAMFQALAPVIANILATTGAVFGTVLGQIATALSQPAFATGLQQFFAGILSGIQAVAPALPALASAFGAFLSFAGALGAVLGPVLGSLLSALAPILTTILNAVKPLLPVLGDGLVEIFEMLAPVLSELISGLLPPIVSLISALVPLLMPIVEAIMPILSALLPPLVSIIEALLPILTPILSILTPIAELLSAVLLPILELLSPAFEILGGVISALVEIIAGTLKTAVVVITGLLTGDLAGTLVELEAIWTSVFNGMSASFEDIWNGIINYGKGMINNMIGLIEGMVNGMGELINGLTDGVRDVLGSIEKATGISVSIKMAKVPKITVPRLAVGADILATPGGILAMLGEGGRDERVIDRGLGNRALELTNALALRALAATDGRGDGGVPPVTLVNPDPHVLMEMLMQRLEGKLGART